MDLRKNISVGIVFTISSLISSIVPQLYGDIVSICYIDTVSRNQTERRQLLVSWLIYHVFFSLTSPWMPVLVMCNLIIFTTSVVGRRSNLFILATLKSIFSMLSLHYIFNMELILNDNTIVPLIMTVIITSTMYASIVNLTLKCLNNSLTISKNYKRGEIYDK